MHRNVSIDVKASFRNMYSVRPPSLKDGCTAAGHIQLEDARPPMPTRHPLVVDVDDVASELAITTYHKMP